MENNVNIRKIIEIFGKSSNCFIDGSSSKTQKQINFSYSIMLNFIFNHIYILVFQQNACQKKKNTMRTREKWDRTVPLLSLLSLLPFLPLTREKWDRTDTKYERERERSRNWVRQRERERTESFFKKNVRTVNSQSFFYLKHVRVFLSNFFFISRKIISFFSKNIRFFRKIIYVFEKS